MNGLVAFVVWRSDVRHFLVLINVLAILALAGYLAWSVLSRRGPEKTPANLTPFLADEDLEGRRLERVLGLELDVRHGLRGRACSCTWLREPDRQDHSIAYFKNGSVERGAVVVRELVERGVQPACCRCSARTATAPTEAAASTTTVIDPDGPDGAAGPRVRSLWKVPPLNTRAVALLARGGRARSSRTAVRAPRCSRAACSVVARRTMQSIQDLVAYIQSIQLTPDESQKEAAKSARARAAAAAGAARRGEGRAQRRSDANPPTTGATRCARRREGGAHDRARRTRDDEHRRPPCDVQGARDRARRTRRTPDGRQAAQAKACRDVPHRGRRLRQARPQALAWSQAWCRLAPGRERRAAAVRAELRALPHRGLVDLRSDAARTARVRRSACPAVAAARAAASASTCATAATIRRFGQGTTRTAASTPSVDFVTHGLRSRTSSTATRGIGSGRCPASARCSRPR